MKTRYFAESMSAISLSEIIGVAAVISLPSPVTILLLSVAIIIAVFPSPSSVI